tara:strand:- start:477 stop:989 length:513 start_codon:yes stop_codon:yes gene_type:complete
MLTSIFGDKCERKNKNNLYKNLEQIKHTKEGELDYGEKIKYLLHDLLHPEPEVVPPFTRADVEKLARYKDFSKCPDDVNLEAAKLVIAHENAIAEIAKFGEEQGRDMPNGQYPLYKNWQLASEDFIIEKIQEKQPTAGGKKRKYKRKTNKRKTNKKKTNKRKTYKKRTKK